MANNSRALLTVYQKIYSTIAGVALLLLTSPAAAAETPETKLEQQPVADSHYTPVGFFDIHVCNWPDRKLFFMSLFSTTRYKEIKSIEVSSPDGSTMTTLNLEKFKITKADDNPEKHVFMTQIDVPDKAANGWYTARIHLADGTQFIAKDYVIIASLPRPSEMKPVNNAEQIPIPEKLTWSAVKGSRYYRVFIRDIWNDSELIYKSELLRQPELVPPAGLLQADGLYSWKVHARDINEDVVLGDFNQGSLSRTAAFSTSSN